jgi:hypothetical protein
MLAVIFVNDGTGGELFGSYDWKVLINQTVLAKGRLDGHNRSLGWRGLVKHFAGQECGEKEVKHMRKIKVGDRVILKNPSYGTIFKTGVVRRIKVGFLSIKRDGYLGHEYTWWSNRDWKLID